MAAEQKKEPGSHTVKPRTRNAELTRAAILDAARRLFAEKAIATVSIRDIAAAAGVSHGLVQQYFGTREKMVASIIKQEIDTVLAAIPPVSTETADVNLELIRRELRAGMERFRDFALLITRAELDGVEPEKMLDPGVMTPAMQLSSTIAGLQTRRQPCNSPVMDPALVSAYINAALFGFGTMAPWLMSSVGLKPEDYRKRFDEIVDITMNIIGLATGTTGRKNELPAGQGPAAAGKPRRRQKAGRPSPSR